MATSETLKKWQAGLRATLPLVGGLRRKWAMDALEAQQNDPDVVLLLVEALGLSDQAIAERADAALRDLTEQPAVDRLCALWAKQRDDALGKIIADRSYIAKTPLQLKILTALKCDKRLALDRAEVIPFVVGLLGDPDETVRTGAMQSMEKVVPGAAQDALCDEAIKNPAGPAAQLCLRTGKRPSDHERLCLFLFVTRQLDEYFKEDDEFENLRIQLQRADALVREHVMEVYRSGDIRVQGLIEARSKTLSELSDRERRTFLESCSRHRDWARLFSACLELPLSYSIPALESLRHSGWEPEQQDLRSAYRQILADAPNEAAPPQQKTSATSSLFERWLAAGTTGELAKLDSGPLLERLKTATPPDGTAIVAALAAKKPVAAAAEKAVHESPHWLVRLAGHATGLCRTKLTEDRAQDPNYWITELTLATGLLDFWPGKATPADLEALAAAPAETWAGKLGAARKVLRTILAHRSWGIIVEDFLVQPDEYGVVVEDAE
jgi:hypothetical protein